MKTATTSILIRCCTTFVVATLLNAGLPAQTIPVNLTDLKLQAHANLPQHNPPGAPLSNLLKEARSLAPAKGVKVWSGLDFTLSDGPGNLVGITNELLLKAYQRQACLADIVVVGHIESSLSHLSAFTTAVYTDYLMVIDRVLKSNETLGAKVTHLIATRPGGSVSLPDGNVRFDFEEYAKLDLQKTYLQFLHYIPETGAYTPVDSFSTLTTDGRKWVITRKAASGFDLPEFVMGVFEKAVANWSTACGK